MTLQSAQSQHKVSTSPVRLSAAFSYKYIYSQHSQHIYRERERLASATKFRWILHPLFKTCADCADCANFPISCSLSKGYESAQTDSMCAESAQANGARPGDGDVIEPTRGSSSSEGSVNGSYKLDCHACGRMVTVPPLCPSCGAVLDIRMERSSAGIGKAARAPEHIRDAELAKRPVGDL